MAAGFFKRAKRWIRRLGLVPAVQKRLKIKDSGAWNTENRATLEQAHRFDGSLADALAELFHGTSVVDFGCGMGDYLGHFRNRGIHCEGYDGNPYSAEITGGLVETLDLSQPIDLDRKFDWVLSLEVGEHIPKEYEHVFIDNLHRHNQEGVVLSWAVVGQGGHGHFNEQNNAYIKSVFSRIGYENDIEKENYLREKCTLWWFKNTIMVFRKRGA